MSRTVTTYPLDLAGPPLEKGELAGYGVQVVNWEPAGPSGWPTAQLRGKEDDVVQALLEWYGADEVDVQEGVFYG